MEWIIGIIILVVIWKLKSKNSNKHKCSVCGGKTVYDGLNEGGPGNSTDYLYHCYKCLNDECRQYDEIYSRRK